MKLKELLASGLVIEILGHRRRLDPTLYKEAGIPQSNWQRWKEKAMSDNPTGMYKTLREQLDKANSICMEHILARLDGYAEEVVETREKLGPNGEVLAKYVNKKPDVQAGIFVLRARFPELDPKVAAEEDGV